MKIYFAGAIRGEAPQPEGLPDSSRWSERSVDHRNTYEQNDAPRRGARKGRIFALSPLQGADDQSLGTGGLRFAPTSGYFRATLAGCQDSSWMFALVDSKR